MRFTLKRISQRINKTFLPSMQNWPSLPVCSSKKCRLIAPARWAKQRITKSPIGSKDIKLERAIRAHANFCETVPISFFLSLILYFNNLLLFSVPAIICLSIGRTIHARAVSDINENLKKRVIGMRLTIISIKIQLFGVLFYISQLIFILLKQ
ncbi:MAG: MAPEG family protein [Gammaproteobacteria bacterium]|nr:MAPEG family protein [Gammaproteobacteria bacterium]